MEYVARNGWRNVWLESDSSGTLLVFKNATLVPMHLRNRWHNCIHLGMQIILSHIFREGNFCADKLANVGHSIQGSVLFEELHVDLRVDFFRDRFGLSNFRFP